MSYKSVWDFGRAGKTNYSVHGIGEYPSKIRPIVIHEIVGRFSRLGDTVLDPFCGCGTVAVEAKLQGKNSINYDINRLALDLAQSKLNTLTPRKMKETYSEFLDDYLREMNGGSNTEFSRIQLEKKILQTRRVLQELENPGSPYYRTTHVVEQRDARKLELESESVDAVITDIPYASMIKYSDLSDDLSNIEDYDPFIKELRIAFGKTTTALRKGRYCVIFCADYRVGAARRILPVHVDVVNMMRELGLNLFDIYIWRYYRSGAFRPFGAPPFQAMNIHIYILVFYKPTGEEELNKKNRPIRYRPRLIEKLNSGKSYLSGGTLVKFLQGNDDASTPSSVSEASQA